LLIAVLAITLAVAAFHVPVSLALESRRIHSRLSNDESWGDLGDLYAAQGMYRSAQGCFAVARLLDPVDIEWQEKSKGWTEIVPVIRQLKVQDGAWVRGLGAKALTQEAPQTAFALLEQARLLDPGDPANAPGVRLREIRLSFQDPTAWVALGDAFAGLGDARFAAGSYAVARLAGGDGLEEKAPDLAAAVPVLHELGPYDTHWLVRLAEAAYSLGSSTAAKDLYALADSWAGGNPEWEDRQRALETIEQLGTGLGESSGKAVWTSLAEAYAALGDTAKAQACNGVALLLDPADAELRAKPYSLSGALALLRGLGIQNDEWVGNRGDAAASLGDTAEALELYRWALSLDTDDTEWPGRVNLFATIEDLRQRVLASYRNDELWGDFGDAYGAAGFSAQAAACYSVARLIQPMDSEWLAKALTLSSPVGLLRSFDIRDDEWIGDLGDSAGTLGNAQVAHELYAFALELDPDDSEWPAKAAEN
jgi:tetratricopeptide (TPR) repeat protein